MSKRSSVPLQLVFPWLLAALLVTFLVSTAKPASATYVACGARYAGHVNNSRGGCTYPNNGYWWIQRGGDQLYKMSDACRTPAESTARTNFDSDLKGGNQGATDAFGQNFLNGISLIRWPNTSQCVVSSSPDTNTDIWYHWEARSTWYDVKGRGDYGGVTTSLLGSSSWCVAVGTTYPCGIHYSEVELNQYRFNNVYSDAYEAQVLLHETGHSMGFSDYCGGGLAGFSSISEDDVNCPMVGQFTAIDRARINDTIYKNR